MPTFIICTFDYYFQMYVPLLKIEQTYYAIRNKSQAMPTVQIYIDELTNILNCHLNNLVSYVTIRKGKVLNNKYNTILNTNNFMYDFHTVYKINL